MNNGKIDKTGKLWIERAGKMKPQDCPYHPEQGVVRCGDWCPMFGEPNRMEHSGRIHVEVCRRLLVFDTFEDERGKE